MACIRISLLVPPVTAGPIETCASFSGRASLLAACALATLGDGSRGNPNPTLSRLIARLAGRRMKGPRAALPRHGLGLGPASKAPGLTPTSSSTHARQPLDLDRCPRRRRPLQHRDLACPPPLFRPPEHRHRQRSPGLRHPLRQHCRCLSPRRPSVPGRRALSPRPCAPTPAQQGSPAAPRPPTPSLLARERGPWGGRAGGALQRPCSRRARVTACHAHLVRHRRRKACRGAFVRREVEALKLEGHDDSLIARIERHDVKRPRHRALLGGACEIAHVVEVDCGSGAHQVRDLV
eukprot:2141015-Rhodomonas_salina.3